MSEGKDSKDIIGKFVGDEIVKEGEKDRNKWTKSKFKFQVDGDKVWNFTVFTPWTKKDGTAKKGKTPDELKKGEFYKVMYSEYQSDEMEYPAKTAICIFSAKEPTEAQNKGSAAKPSGAGLKGLLDSKKDQLEPLADKYFEGVDKEMISANHFIGTMIRSFAKEDCAPLVKIFDERQKK